MSSDLLLSSGSFNIGPDVADAAQMEADLTLIPEKSNERGKK